MGEMNYTNAYHLLTPKEIVEELRRLDAESSYAVGDLVVTRVHDGKRVKYDMTDLMLPMVDFSRRVLVPLVSAEPRPTPTDIPNLHNAWRVPRPEDVRGETHGDFTHMSGTIQIIKRAMHGAESWSQCSATQREALELVATKIGRIVCGDPNHVDHWDDIMGYAALARNRIARPPKAKD